MAIIRGHKIAVTFGVIGALLGIIAIIIPELVIFINPVAFLFTIIFTSIIGIDDNDLLSRIMFSIFIPLLNILFFYLAGLFIEKIKSRQSFYYPLAVLFILITIILIVISMMFFVAAAGL